MSWQDQWEDAAAQERASYAEMPVARMLERVGKGLYGSYSQVWMAIAERAELSEAGWVLFDVLERDIDYLHRMPCAEALLALMGTDEFQPADLGGTHEKVAANLTGLRTILERQIGPRPPAG